MAETSKQYDFVVFGGTGFTGKLVCEELHKVLKADHPNLCWAVAGRSKDRLENVLCGMVAKKVLTEENKNDVGIIEADTSNYESLVAMCKSSRVVLDCVGPYRLYGEQVIKACIEGKSDFLDISGEPLFLEQMQCKYNDAAREAGIYIIGACGFDSIPSDLGTTFAKREFSGVLNTLECYFVMKSGPAGMKGAYGTYASLVHGFSNAETLRKFRKETRKAPPPKIGPRNKVKGFHWNENLRRYALPFPGADVSIVKRSQQYLWENEKEKPVQYSMYMTFPSLFSVFLAGLFVVILKIFTSFKKGKQLLLNNPEFFTLGGFSKSGPSMEQINQASFAFHMKGEGYEQDNQQMERKEKHDKTMRFKVFGPEIGYATTPIAFVQAGLTVLQEKEKLPERGGVFTTASAFNKSDSIFKRMDNRGLKFEVIP